MRSVPPSPLSASSSVAFGVSGPGVPKYAQRLVAAAHHVGEKLRVPGDRGHPVGDPPPEWPRRYLEHRFLHRIESVRSGFRLVVVPAYRGEVVDRLDQGEGERQYEAPGPCREAHLGHVGLCP